VVYFTLSFAHSPGFFASRIGGQHEGPSLDIFVGGPEAVGLNPEQRKAAEMTGIILIHREIERLFGAQCVHAKCEISRCPFLLHRLRLRIYGLFNQLMVDKNGQRYFSQMARINKRPTTSITAQVTP
jgi:hypothetical protein